MEMLSKKRAVPENCFDHPDFAILTKALSDLKATCDRGETREMPLWQIFYAQMRTSVRN